MSDLVDKMWLGNVHRLAFGPWPPVCHVVYFDAMTIGSLCHYPVVVPVAVIPDAESCLQSETSSCTKNVWKNVSLTVAKVS